eukprot:6552271-Alexandrium_andersonii.AAC.1
MSRKILSRVEACSRGSSAPPAPPLEKHLPVYVKTTTALNSSLAEIEKGAKFHMEGAAAPAGPYGEASLSRAPNRLKSATPSVAALGVGWAWRSATPLSRNAETSGLPTSADSVRGARTFRPAGLLRPQPLPCGL